MTSEVTGIYRTFATDPELERHGVVLEYGDVKLRVARAGGANAAFRKVSQAKTKPYRHQLDNDTLDESVGERIMAESYAEGIVQKAFGRDAEGRWVEGKIPSADGALIDATAENLTQLFLALPDFFRDVQAMAGKLTNYRRAELKADEKNS